MTATSVGRPATPAARAFRSASISGVQTRIGTSCVGNAETREIDRSSATPAGMTTTSVAIVIVVRVVDRRNRRFISASQSVMKSGICAVRSVRASQFPIAVCKFAYVSSATGVRLARHRRMFSPILRFANVPHLLTQILIDQRCETALLGAPAEEEVFPDIGLVAGVEAEGKPWLRQ